MARITKTQAELLARKVVETLQSQRVDRTTKQEKATIRRLVKEYQKYRKVYDGAQKKMHEANNAINNFLGPVNYRGTTTIENVTAALERARTPNIDTVMDTILLDSLFEDAADLKKLMDKWVKKFTPAPRKERALAD